MHKILKTTVILSILLCVFVSISNAETTNIYNDVANENSDFSHTANNSTSNSSTYNSNARVSTVSSIPEANLGLNNVLCVILIAIGILLILLAIAILIRSK